MPRTTLDDHDVAELEHLLTLVRDEDGPSLSWPFLHRLKDLIGCDNLNFNGLDSGVRSDYFSQSLDEEEWWLDGPSPGPAADDDPFWQHYWASPPCSYPETSRDYTSVTMVSDFYSTREWHSTGMYVDHVAVAGYEHELQMCLPDGAGRTVRLLCFRTPGRDFGERERFLLALLRPHVAEAHRAALRRRSGPLPLTPRQLELLELVREGRTNRQIARQLGVSEATVRTHLNHIFTRLDVTSRTAAVTRGLQDRWIAS